MYDELVKKLRNFAITADSGNEIGESFYNAVMQAADTIESLEKEVARLSRTLTIPAEKAVTLEGFDIDDLRTFAFTCREAGVDNRDLQVFANNIRFAFDVVYRDMDRVYQNQLRSMTERLPLPKEES